MPFTEVFPCKFSTALITTRQRHGRTGMKDSPCFLPLVKSLSKQECSVDFRIFVVRKQKTNLSKYENAAMLALALKLAGTWTE